MAITSQVCGQFPATLSGDSPLCLALGISNWTWKWRFAYPEPGFTVPELGSSHGGGEWIRRVRTSYPVFRNQYIGGALLS